MQNLCKYLPKQMVMKHILLWVKIKVLILKFRVIVSLAYEVPGTEQKDLHLFVDKLKKWDKLSTLDLGTM